MINKTIRLAALGVLLGSGVFAQSVQDGKKAFFDGRLYEAVNILKTQSGNPEGAYWLVKSYIDHDDIPEANAVLTKALAANPNDPLLLAAKGQLQLNAHKAVEAQQSFNAAIAAANKNNKAAVLNAVGAAIAREFNNVEKVGDINFGVAKLEEAYALEKSVKEKNQDKQLLADIAVNLGDALRKQKPGEGSRPFELYQEALMYDPSFAQAEYRKAMIFKSQRNYPMFMERLDKAIVANPSYLPALYGMYEYWMFMKGDMNSAQLIADKIKAAAPKDPNNGYFAASTHYFNKQYNEAINEAKGVISTAKDLANPSAYKIIAYSLIEGKKDTAAAIPYVDEYFKMQHKDEFMPKDYTLKAMAYSTTPGKEQVIYQTYLDAVKADTSLENKIDILEEGGKFLGTKGMYKLQGDLYAKLLEIKPASRITINDYFNAGYYGYYRSGQYEKSHTLFETAKMKFPDLHYGYLFTYLNQRQIDTTRSGERFIKDADDLVKFALTGKDTTLDKIRVFYAAQDLGAYYANVAKDNAKAIEYFKIASDFTDDADAKTQMKAYIDMLSGKPKAAPNTSKPKK